MLPLVTKINFLISHHYQKKTVKEKKLVQISVCVFQKSKNISMPLNLLASVSAPMTTIKQGWSRENMGIRWPREQLQGLYFVVPQRNLISNFFNGGKQKRWQHWLDNWEVSLTYCPAAFKDIDVAAADTIYCFSEAKIPTKATPTMESWSRSSRRDRLVLWSQVYFRLMESWRFLRNDSRSRASLKNCGNTGKVWIVLNASAQWKVHKEGTFCAKLNQADYTLLDLWPPITKGPRVQTRGLKKAQCKVLVMISSNTHQIWYEASLLHPSWLLFGGHT